LACKCLHLCIVNSFSPGVANLGVRMPGAAGVLLLITLSSAYVLAAQASQTGAAPADVARLSSAFKLLRLQLKQAAETAEHVGELLLQLDKQSSSPALPKDSHDDHLPARPNQNAVPLVSQDSPQSTCGCRPLCTNCCRTQASSLRCLQIKRTAWPRSTNEYSAEL